MFCPRCHADTSSVSGRCAVCGTAQLQADAPQPDVGETSYDLPQPALTASGAARGAGDLPTSSPTGLLSPGQSFGARYHVVRTLGVGGMGAVYQAWDDELGIAVA